MNSEKQKIQEVQKARKRITSVQPHYSKDEAEVFWEEEVQLMKQQVFRTEEEAVEYIVNRVADKLSMNFQSDQEHRAFVKELILANDELMAMIRRG